MEAMEANTVVTAVIKLEGDTDIMTKPTAISNTIWAMGVRGWRQEKRCQATGLRFTKVYSGNKKDLETDVYKVAWSLANTTNTCLECAGHLGAYDFGTFEVYNEEDELMYKGRLICR